MARTRRIPSSLVAIASLLLLSACAGTARPALSPVPEPADVGVGPDLEDEEVVPVEVEMLGNAAYDLPVEANSWVEAELEFLVGQRRQVIERWVARGDYYEDFVKGVLRSYNLPTDLFHLAMIESGFITSARSRAGAVGMWQFMPATGRMEGLRVDELVDERMDPVRATHAAARHLTTLHRQFNGDWALAAAAYNAGSGRIGRGMQRFGASSFWELATLGDLAEETKHYVPRLYAMTIVTRDRERFGLPPAPVERAGFAYDSVLVDSPTPLFELAIAGGMDVEVLAQLNPHLLQRVTPPGGYWVWAPRGTGDALQIAYLESSFRRQGGLGSYAARRGDSLGRLAEMAQVSPAYMRELNPRVNWDRLQPGTRISLPLPMAETLAARPAERPAPAERVASSAPAPQRAAQPARNAGSAANRGGQTRYAQHTVRNGETLWSIARRYGVSVSAIQEANRLSGNTIVSGRSLRIPQTGQAQSAARGNGTNGNRSNGNGAASAAEHVVKTGETLWSIAREYGASVSAIQNANRIGDGHIIPGQKLLIPR